MNINKLNNVLQYWHNNTEMPNKTKLILIEPKNINQIFQQFPISISSKSIYFIGKLYNSKFDLIDIYIDHDNDYEKNYTLITYNLDSLKLSLHSGYNNWDLLVDKWIYLSDCIQLMQQTKKYYDHSYMPKPNKLILFEVIKNLQPLKSFNENLWCIGTLQLTEIDVNNTPTYKLLIFNICSNKHLLHMYMVNKVPYIYTLNKSEKSIKHWIYLDDIKEYFE